MALMPGVVQRPVAAHGGPMSQVVGVVIHVTAGEGDPYNEFANPNNQVSSHFGIGNGQGGMADWLIEQYVDTAYASWAQAAGNATYISVETEGEPTDPLTPAQVASFARIMAWVNQTYKVPLVSTDFPGLAGLITHGAGGAAWGGHLGCPGDLRKAQRGAILSQAQALVTPTPPTSKEYKIMDSVALSDGTIVSHAVTPQGHYLEITRKAGTQGTAANNGLSIIDITAAYPQFAVQP